MAADGGSGVFIPAAKQLLLDIDDEIIVDGFAGCGGMSEAIYQAFGRHPYAALNHSEDALSCHAVNHPQTHHWLGDIRESDPIEVCGGRRVGLLHLSPDCTHFSQAKGGQPRDKKIRALAWVALRWAGKVSPRIITLENVWAMVSGWGPLIAKRDAKSGRVLKAVRHTVRTKTGRIKKIKLSWVPAEKGERVPVQDQFLIPDPKRKGETFKRFVKCLELLGYKVAWTRMEAQKWGAATSRARLFLIARRDGGAIVIPQQTHFKNPTRGQKAERGAYEYLDFKLPTRSIFNREKSLAEATHVRLACGVVRYVRDSADPFLLPLTHKQKPGEAPRVHNIHDPIPTITGANRGEFAVAEPVFAKEHQKIVAAFMAQHNNNPGGRPNAGHDIRQPMSALMGTCSHQAVVAAHLAHFRNNCDARDIRDPLTTLSAGGEHHRVVECRLDKDDWDGARRVAEFLNKYHAKKTKDPSRSELGRALSDSEVLAIASVKLGEETVLITDVCMRLITPREALLCQGLPHTYIIEYGHDGRKFTRTTQFKLIGNSVSPPPAIALLQANLPEWVQKPTYKQAA